MALAQAGYILINCSDAMFEPEVHAGPIEIDVSYYVGPMRQDAEEIRLLRRISSWGLTQREVARRLGVSQALVSMWARGRRKPGRVRMAALRQLVADVRSVPADGRR